MKRIIVLVVTVLVLSAMTGCGGGSAAPSSSAESVDSGAKASQPDEFAALDLETDAEREAFALADSTEGRTWASGDFQNGTPVEGDARLVGYTFRLNDGTTQYQVRVMNGAAYGYVGEGSDTALAAPYNAGWKSDPAPESERQRAAFEVAKAETAKVNPNAISGGIECYIFMFPPDEYGASPEVLIYHDRSFGDFGMGGSWY